MNNSSSLKKSKLYFEAAGHYRGIPSIYDFYRLKWVENYLDGKSVLDIATGGAEFLQLVKHNYEIADIDSVAEEWNKFWENNKGGFGVTADRNSRYLKWRIFDNPNLAYEFFLARRHGEIVGEAITKDFGEGGAMIVDIIAKDNNQIIFNTILDGVVNILKESGVSVVHITTLLSHNFLNQSLRRNGFTSLYTLRKAIRKIVKNDASLLMVKSLDNSLDPAKVSDPACWYYTDILTEGVG